MLKPRCFGPLLSWTLNHRKLWQSSKEATKAVSRCKQPRKIIKVVKFSKSQGFVDGVFCAAALHRLSALSSLSSRSDVLEVLELGEAWTLCLDEASRNLHTFGAQELAIAALAVAKARHERSKVLFHQILDRVLPGLHLDSQPLPMRYCSNLLWAAASLRSADALFEEAAAAVQKPSAHGPCNARDAAQLCWAFAAQRHPQGLEMLESFAVDQHTKLATYSDHDLATTMWAAATMTCPETQGRVFFEELVDAACELSSSFAPQGLSMTLWACATLNSAASLDIPKEKVLWALATMDARTIRSEEAETGVTATEAGLVAVESLSNSLANQLLACNGQDIANALWALATLRQMGAGHLVQQVCNSFPDLPLQSFSAQNCANLLWALAHQGRETLSEDFICALAERASHVLDWDEQSLSISVWALAVLGQRSASLPLLESMTSDLDKLKGFSSESLSVFAWTCGLLGVTAHPTPMLAVIVRCRAETLTLDHLTSILLAFARIWPQHLSTAKSMNTIKRNG